MHVVSQMLTAFVVGLAAAVVGWFGLALASSEAAAERTVRRIPASASAQQTLPAQTDADAPIPC